MDKFDMKKLLQDVASGEISQEAAELKLKIEPFEELGCAKPDYHRGIRQGIPEVIYGEGKTPEQSVKISKALLEKGQKTVLITRLSYDDAKYVKNYTKLKYYEESRIGIIGEIPKSNTKGIILVITGGTSDMPVAEEASLTCEVLGNKV